MFIGVIMKYLMVMIFLLLQNFGFAKEINGSEYLTISDIKEDLSKELDIISELQIVNKKGFLPMLLVKGTLDASVMAAFVIYDYQFLSTTIPYIEYGGPIRPLQMLTIAAVSGAAFFLTMKHMITNIKDVLKKLNLTKYKQEDYLEALESVKDYLNQVIDKKLDSKKVLGNVLQVYYDKEGTPDTFLTSEGYFFKTFEDKTISEEEVIFKTKNPNWFKKFSLNKEFKIELKPEGIILVKNY